MSVGKDNQPFYVGQEVVAIRDHGQGAFKRGDKFTVQSIRRGCCTWEINVSIPSRHEYWRCVVCTVVKVSDGIWWFNSFKFAPIERKKNTISITATFDTKEVEEVLDVPKTVNV